MDYTTVTDADRAKWRSLSKAERYYLQLVADGSTNPQAARKSGKAVSTIANALKRVNTKLEVSTRTEAVLWAVMRGYIEVEAR